MLFSAMAGYVYAANITQKAFSKTMYGGTYSSVADPRVKENASDMFIQIDSSSIGGTYCVRAMGCGKTVVNAVNYTVYNNELVDHVVCNKGKMYSIDNVVYERSYGYGAIFVMQTGGYGTVSGYWAPDTAQSFDPPSAL